MDLERDKKRMNVEDDDRLSYLSDDLLHKILSLVSIKQAVETSALSTRWRYVWSSMRYLNFSSQDFSTLPEFSKFVSQVLSHRDNRVEVYSVKLSFTGKVGQAFVKRILNYAFAHNVQQLEVVLLVEKISVELPLCLFKSQSLKHLTLTKRILGRSSRGIYVTFASMWQLPALTTLCLDQISLYDDDLGNCLDIISKCMNLKSLILQRCHLIASDGFDICHSRLSELTLESVGGNLKFINVVAPQLKNLVIKGSSKKILISAPDLKYLLLNAHNRLDFSADGFRSLEKVDICISYPHDPIVIVNLLQLLCTVKVLSLNLEIFETLSSSVEMISHQPSLLANLKSLKIYPSRINDWELSEEKLTVSAEVIKYLLGGSPSATFTMISREDIIAQRLMTELRELLEDVRDNIENNGADQELGKAPIESHSAEMHEPEKSQLEMKMQLHNKENPELVSLFVTSGWNKLSELIEERRAKACVIIWKLEDIEKLLTKMSASKRAVIQPCLSKLFADADIIMNKITEYLKIHCGEYHNRLIVRFRELATALKPSS